MNEGHPKEENIKNNKEIVSDKEKEEWLNGMEEYVEQLEQEIERLKTELRNIKDEDKLHETLTLIEELEQQTKGMKEFIGIDRDSDEVLYRLK